MAVAQLFNVKARITVPGFLTSPYSKNPPVINFDLDFLS
jgi:hypothetical protein